jgi:hypothetical protein
VDLLHVHVVEQEAVEDGLADLIGVVGIRFDAVAVGTEGGAAVARGFIFRGRDMDEDEGVIGNATDGALMEAFAAAALSAVGTRGSSRCVTAVAMDGFEPWAIVGVLVVGLGMG